MTRTRRIVTLALAAAAFVLADRAFLWIAEHSIRAFDPCKPIVWSDFWWIAALQATVLLLSIAFFSAPQHHN